MNLLIIGGSRFVGYYLVEAARAAGHTVTLFNRGQSNPGAFPDVEEIHGNRDGDLGLLAGRQWDAVIDTCGYVPRVVGASAELLQDAVGRYVFISTISVYNKFLVEGTPEDAPLATLSNADTEQVTGETYGGLKVLCEHEIERVYGERVLIIRPGLIVGPRDTTNRFGYWVRRAASGGEILAPGSSNRPVQFIDVRDLGEWTVRLTEGHQAGIFNAVGPAEKWTLGELLTCAIQVGENPTATLTWVDDEFLVEHGVAYWQHLPLWVAEDYPVGCIINRKAIQHGLTFRPTESIIRDTLAWLRTQDEPPPHPQGPIGAERESELLTAWQARST